MTDRGEEAKSIRWVRNGRALPGAAKLSRKQVATSVDTAELLRHILL